MASTVNVSARVVWQIVGNNVRRFALSQKGCNKRYQDRGEFRQFCCSEPLFAAFKMTKQVVYNARDTAQRGLKSIAGRAIIPRMIGVDHFLRVGVLARKGNGCRGILRPFE